MEYILLNTIMALLDYPGATLMGMNRLLSDKEFRKKVVSVIQDPVVKMFWVKEFASFTEKYAAEAVAPVQNSGNPLEGPPAVDESPQPEPQKDN